MYIYIYLFIYLFKSIYLFMYIIRSRLSLYTPTPHLSLPPSCSGSHLLRGPQSLQVKLRVSEKTGPSRLGIPLGPSTNELRNRDLVGGFSPSL